MTISPSKKEEQKYFFFFNSPFYLRNLFVTLLFFLPFGPIIQVPLTSSASSWISVGSFGHNPLSFAFFSEEPQTGAVAMDSYFVGA